MSRVDLFRPFMSQEAREAVVETMTADTVTGRLYIGQGVLVDEFEDALKTFLASGQDVLTTNSCTSALDLALHLCGVGGQQARRRSALSPKSDVVISTPMTCTASNSPIVTRGGAIVWADVDPLTGLIDPKDVAECIYRLWSAHSIEPNAIVAVDWGGHLADYPGLREIAQVIGEPHEAIPIIQDAAHSFGTTVERDTPFMDTMQTEEIQRGHYVAFSFQAIKVLTTGDGGALVCPNASETERARLLRWYGLDRRSNVSYRCSQSIEEIGYKYHMNDVAAAMGIENLRHVENNLDQHRANANYYGGVLHGLEGVLLPPSLANGDAIDLDSAWWLFTLLVSDRDHFMAFMDERGIETSQVHARNDLHAAFMDAAFEDCRQLPGVDFFARHQVSIPVGWWLTADDRDRVAEAVVTWAKAHGQELVPPDHDKLEA